MKRAVLIFVMLLLLSVPVSAQDYTAPEVSGDAAALLPEDRDSFGEGLWYVVTSAFSQLHPSLMEGIGTSLSVIAAALLICILQNCAWGAADAVRLAGVVCISVLLFSPADAWISAAADTVCQLSEYGKLLLPVITAALAAQGGGSTSAALYTATITFDALLSGLISTILMPLVYIYLVFSVMQAAVGDTMMKKLRSLVKSAMTWLLKIVLYTFTGYISITGVVSGTADQNAIKAAKLTISGVVPVVGSILSDASETLLVSAGLVKNTVGIAGMLAVIAIVIVPFLQIGVQYLLLKLTAAVCALISHKSIADLVEDFSGAMGFLLGMTGAVCMIFLISLVCFLRGMG